MRSYPSGGRSPLKTSSDGCRLTPTVARNPRPDARLLRAGATGYALTAAVRSGRIVRVRQGWYALPYLDGTLLAAARVGGRLACVSAARHLGLMARAGGLHVEVPGNAARLRDPGDYRRRLAGEAHVHWSDTATVAGPICVTVRAALRSMATCVSPELTVAAADSALHLELLDAREWDAELQRFPTRLRSLLSRVDGRAESITESVVRFRLAALGIRTRPQVAVPGVGNVDLVIGDALVIEVDGKAWHNDEERFEKDRRRDARLSTRGYRVLRFSYAQVFNSWHEVRGAILAAMVRGDHLR